MELQSIVRRKDGTGAELELCQVVATQEDPTATLRAADGSHFNWSQRLTRPATPEEENQFRRDWAEAKPKVDILYLDTEIAGVDETRVVALVEGELVGSIAVQHQERTSADIRQLYVHEHKRTEGIGTLLVNACIAIAIESECESIGALIENDNTKVIGFYKKIGWSVCYQFPDKSAVMTKQLGAK